MLEGQDTRKTAEIKTEDGKKERHYLYYDGESVAGKVSGAAQRVFTAAPAPSEANVVFQSLRQRNGRRAVISKRKLRGAGW